MTSSIYHFFEDLYQRRQSLKSDNIKPDKFPYKDSLLSLYGSKGKFPDMVIKLCETETDYTGGELIEVKDSRSGYTISSFNSTLPSGTKLITEIATKDSKLYQLMENEGDAVYSLLERDVYYLIRGKKNKKEDTVKICIVHGSFFETLPADANLKKAFEQVLDTSIEAANKQNDKATQDSKNAILSLPWERKYFSSREVFA